VVGEEEGAVPIRRAMTSSARRRISSALGRSDGGEVEFAVVSGLTVVSFRDGLIGDDEMGIAPNPGGGSTRFGLGGGSET
jgi:hypothetical protein